MSLSKLAQAGLPVPDGFHVTTAAYRLFITTNKLEPKILKELKAVEPTIPATLEEVSQNIGRLFTAAAMPEEIRKDICSAYKKLQPHIPSRSQKEIGDGNPSPARVAVRSSATAEDLPEASFAGQQETFLNVNGNSNLIKAIQKCWASLFYDPGLRRVIEAFGLQTVSSTSWGAQRVEELLTNPVQKTVYSARNGEVEVYEVTIPEHWKGLTLGELLTRFRSVTRWRSPAPADPCCRKPRSGLSLPTCLT